MKSKIWFSIIFMAVLTLMFCACKKTKTESGSSETTPQFIVATAIPGLNSSTKPSPMDSPTAAVTAPATITAPSASAPSSNAPSSKDPSGSETETEVPSYVSTPVGTPTMRTEAPSAKPTAEPTINVQQATAIPNINASNKPGSLVTPSGDVVPTASATQGTTESGKPGVTTAPSDDPYDGFYDIMSSALYVEEKISDNVKICYPKIKNDSASVDPYLVFVSGKSSEGDASYMLEFLGNTYLLEEKPETIMMYWSVMNLNSDGYYHIDNLYILVDDQYIVFKDNITTPKLPGRGFINENK